MSTIEAIDGGQVNDGAAQVYEQFFVPALFQEWPAHIITAAKVQSGQRVLDVACGTGVLTRELARAVGDSAQVDAIDINDNMLAVARQLCSNVNWRNAAAETLPFTNSIYDVTTCQFGLMFFTDRRQALIEMWRVLKPGGKLVIAVWDSIEKSPGYATLSSLLHKLFGDPALRAISAPYNLGDKKLLRELLAAANITNYDITTLAGTARFPSLAAWMHTEIRGWTLADLIDDRQFEQLLEQSQTVLRGFVGNDGTVSFAAPAHIITATKA